MLLSLIIDHLESKFLEEERSDRLAFFYVPPEQENNAGLDQNVLMTTNDYQKPLGEPRTISEVFHKYRSHIKLESFTNERSQRNPERLPRVEQILHSQGL